MDNFQGRQQNLSLGMNQIYNAVPFYPYDKIVGKSHVEWMYFINLAKGVSQACAHLFLYRDAFRRRQADGLGLHVTCVRRVDESASP